MALKQRHKTRWNGDKQHEDGLNINRDMAYPSKCEKTNIFEIQTMDTHTPHPQPPKRPSRILDYMLKLTRHFCNHVSLPIYSLVNYLSTVYCEFFFSKGYFVQTTKIVY